MIYNEGGLAKVLLVADHASPYFPASMNQLGVADWVLERHVTWDIGSDLLTAYLADLIDAPAILAGFSRLIADSAMMPFDNFLTDCQPKPGTAELPCLASP